MKEVGLELNYQVFSGSDMLELLQKRKLFQSYEVFFFLLVRTIQDEAALSVGETTAPR